MDPRESPLRSAVNCSIEIENLTQDLNRPPGGGVFEYVTEIEESEAARASLEDIRK